MDAKSRVAMNLERKGVAKPDLESNSGVKGRKMNEGGRVEKTHPGGIGPPGCG